MITFFVVLVVAEMIVIAQGVSAHNDGWFSQGQMRRYGNTGTSFLEHGGMWADALVVSPTMAWVINEYFLGFTSNFGLGVLAGVVVLVGKSLRMYRDAGITHPEAHAYGKKITSTAWLHGIYAGWALWTFVLFLLASIVPVASTRDLYLVGTSLTVLFPLGVIKFNSKWKWGWSETIQVGAETTAVWLIILSRTWLEI